MEINTFEIIKLKEGDKSVFKFLFEKESQRLITLASHYVDYETAEDIVQEVFINLWNNRNTINENLNIRNYLTVIVKNNCLNFLRNKKSKTLLDLKIILEMESTSSKDEEEILMQIERIKNLIEQLPPVCQEVLKLSVYSGLKYDEIAVRLSISKNTVKFHIKTAYRWLRENFS